MMSAYLDFSETAHFRKGKGRSTFSVSGSADLTFLLGKIGSLGTHHSCGCLLFTLYGFYNLNLLPTLKKNQGSLNSH